MFVSIVGVIMDGGEGGVRHFKIHCTEVSFRLSHVG